MGAGGAGYGDAVGEEDGAEKLGGVGGGVFDGDVFDVGGRVGGDGAVDADGRALRPGSSTRSMWMLVGVLGAVVRSWVLLME